MLHFKAEPDVFQSFVHILLCKLGIQHQHLHLSLSVCQQVSLLGGGGLGSGGVVACVLCLAVY